MIRLVSALLRTSCRLHRNRHAAAADDLAQTDLAALAQLQLAIHPHLARGHHGFGGPAAVGDAGRFQQGVERDELTDEFEVDGGHNFRRGVSG